MDETPSFVDPEVLREAGVGAALQEQFREELDILPVCRKKAYLEAVQRAPNLVATESPLKRFLRFASFKMKEAVDRLTFYWESRKAIFGDDRAFLPLVQTGNGSLTEKDLAFLKNSAVHFAFLPNDSEGRTVLYTDLSSECNASTTTCLRIAFYVWSILSENELSQTDGYVSIVGLFRPDFDARFKTAEEMVSVILPVRINTTYLLSCPAQAVRKSFFKTALPAALLALENLSQKREFIYLEDTAAHLLEKMMKSGFSADALPESVGGTYSVEESFLTWQEQRKLFEQGQYDRKIAARLEDDSSNGKKAASSCGDNDRDSDYPLKTSGGQLRESSTSGAASAVCQHHAVFSAPAENNCDQNHQLLLQELQDALRQIPSEEKQAFSEALERVPHLVWHDPGPIPFLQREKNNAKAAARGLVSFWKARQERFADRAFLPMNQTGHGALSSQDLEVLRSGYLQILPCDDNGRQVVLFQPKRLTPAMRESVSILRCSFYMNCVVSENEVSQLLGFVFLRIVGTSKFKLKMKESLVSENDSGSPSPCGSFHTLVYHDVAATKMVSSTVVPAILKSYGDAANRTRFVHRGVSPSELADHLKDHGIYAGGLPPTLGGTWTDDYFLLWQKERVSLEKKRAAAFFAASTL